MADLAFTVECDLRDMVLLYRVEERRAAKARQRQLIEIVASLGGDARAFRRERARRAKAIIAEFYSRRFYILKIKACKISNQY